MSRVRTFFLTEGGQCLADLRREIEAPDVDVAALHRAVRRFRGSAEMARFGSLAETARELEEWLRPRVASGHAGSGGARDGTALEADRVRSEVREVLELLERGVEEVGEGRMGEDPKMEAGMVEHMEDEGTSDPEVVPVEALEYQGVAALERAGSLREALEDALVSDEPAGPILDELFDLIRLGSK